MRVATLSLLEVAGDLELLPSLLASPAGSPDDVTAAFCASLQVPILSLSVCGWRRAASWRAISRVSFTASRGY